MCIFIRRFRVSVQVSGIRGFSFGDGFPPETVFGSGSGFDFGFWFWVHGDSTRSEPDPLPSLLAGLACCALGRPCADRRECWAEWRPTALFLFLKIFSNLFLKQACKFNINLCKNPKVVKLILLGS
jgi:hypothetical protein